MIAQRTNRETSSDFYCNSQSKDAQDYVLGYFQPSLRD
jgi:hypothetical protein